MLRFGRLAPQNVGLKGKGTHFLLRSIILLVILNISLHSFIQLVNRIAACALWFKESIAAEEFSLESNSQL